MIEVQMSKDIKEYEPKIIAFFTRRQVICIIIAACYAIPLYFLLDYLELEISVSIPIVGVSLLPAIVCGWVKMYGMPFETFFFKCILPSLFYPTKRRYEDKNVFEEFKPEDITKPGFKQAKRHKMGYKEKKEYKESMTKYGSSF